MSQEHKPEEMNNRNDSVPEGHDDEHYLQKAHLQAIFDNIHDCIFTLDHHGMITGYNQAMVNVLGYSRKQLMGCYFDEFIHGGHSFSDYLLRLNRGHPSVKRKLKTDICVTDQQGSIIDMSLTLTKISESESIALIGSLHDISERKRVEKLKDSFVSTVNHELRTPLTSIQCSIDLLEKQWQSQWPKSMANLLAIAQSNTRRIVHIVNDILDMQKVAEGHFDFQCQPLNLQSLIETALSDNQGYASHHQVHYEAEAIDPGLQISGDQDRLHQVLTNLLSNAAKFSPAESTVSVYTELKKEGAWVRVCVQDTGKGIPKALHQRIFEPFFQAETEKESGQPQSGTGLGLSISQRIIEGHNGYMGVKSPVTGGSIFFFELPTHH